jgi:hypothetical protein
MQRHLPPTGVTPGPPGQRDLNLGLAPFGVYNSRLCFAVLLSALVAVAHPVSGDDSKAARTVAPLNATPLDVSHMPIPVGVDGGQPAPPARPRRWSGNSERGGRHGSPLVLHHDDASPRGCRPAPRASWRDRRSSSVAPQQSDSKPAPFWLGEIAIRELCAAVWYGCRPP